MPSKKIVIRPTIFSFTPKHWYVILLTIVKGFIFQKSQSMFVSGGNTTLLHTMFNLIREVSSTTHLKHDEFETKDKDKDNGPLTTQPVGGVRRL